MNRSTVVIAASVAALGAGLAASAMSRAKAEPRATAQADLLAYAYAETLGTTGSPWPRSNAFLNQPLGIGADRCGLPTPADGTWSASARVPWRSWAGRVVPDASTAYRPGGSST
ncbi:MAG: hypothetical protein ACE5EL_02495 [Anaerolineae bacterium]